MTPDAGRIWFLTWTTYGTWLPGDRRGFVGSVREMQSNLPVTRRGVGVPYENPNGHLEHAAKSRMKGCPVRLTPTQATIIADQIEETVNVRRWTLLAVAIMTNHVHVMVSVPGDPEPDSLLRDLKVYTSRALNAEFGKPSGGTWWTRSGSKRKCHDDASLLTHVRYVRDQRGALVVRLHAEYG